MACSLNQQTRKDKTAYRVLVPWNVSRTRGQEIARWFHTDEAIGTWAMERVDKDGAPMVAAFFTDLPTATAFKLKFG